MVVDSKGTSKNSTSDLKNQVQNLLMEHINNDERTKNIDSEEKRKLFEVVVEKGRDRTGKTIEGRYLVKVRPTKKYQEKNK